MPDRPSNVILLVPDEMRGDCLGANALNRDIRTPHMDALAARGVLFARHFTTFPKCVPARIAMMTGRYCHTDGYRTIHQHLPFGTPDVLSSLRARGWQAALFGHNHCWENLFEATHKPPELAPGQQGLAIDHHSWTTAFRPIYARHKAADHASAPERWTPLALEDGYDYAGCVRKNWADEAYAEQAIEYLTRVRDKGRPFFLQVNFGAPHPRYGVEEPYFSMYDRDTLDAWPHDLPAGAPLPFLKQREIRMGRDAPDRALREIQAVYMAMISKVDAQIGRVVEAIERERLWDDTLVLLASDHGDFAGQYGLPEKWDTVFPDCLVHVPCALVAPGLPRGARVDSLTEHVDIAPTLCEMLGLDPLPGLHGESLLPTLAGQRRKAAVFADGGHEDEMLRRFDYPVVVNGERKGKQDVYHQCPDTMARARMIRTDRHKMVIRLRGGNELYDLREDRWELVNRWGDPALAPVVLDFQQQLLEWCLRTDTDRPHQERVGA